MKSAALLFLALLGQPAWALQAPDFMVSARSTSKGLIVVATPPSGNHINIQAPMFLQPQARAPRLKPTSAQEKKVIFTVPEESQGPFEIQLYLCDDKKTYCESHRVKFAPPVSTSPSKTGREPEDKAAPEKKPENKQKNKKDTQPRDAHGFILNQPESALSLARQEKRPLLIDFFGIWCPPCNMLDEEVFSSREFQESAAPFVRLKLDADSEISWNLKSRYKVGGYPTVIFTDPEGEEIQRVVGYLPKKVFLEKVMEAWKSRDQSFATLQAKADAGDLSASERVGLTHLERKEYEKAIQYLKPIRKRTNELASAKIGLWEAKIAQADPARPQPELETRLIEALESGIRAAPKAIPSLEWRMKLAELYARKKPELKTKHLQEALTLTRDLIADPERLANQEMSLADAWATLAQTQEELGDSAAKESRESWKKAAQEYQKNAPTTKERGFNLERAYCLWKSGDFAAADTLYLQLEKNYPDEFTFYYGHATMNLARQEFASAEAQAKQALKHSYGDNRLRSVHLLARVYQASGKASDGIELIQKTLQGFQLPDDGTIRSHRYVSSLKTLLQKLKSLNSVPNSG